MGSLHEASEVSATIVHPTCQELYQDVSLLLSRRPHWHCTFHCAALHLNLAVVSACKIQSFTNAESYVGEIARFFNYSTKRQRALDKANEVCTTEAKAKKLKDACRTQLVYRINSYVVFLVLPPAVHTVLDAMGHPAMHQELGTDWGWDGESITKVNGFLFQVQSPSFLIAFKILL